MRRGGRGGVDEGRCSFPFVAIPAASPGTHEGISPGNLFKVLKSLKVFKALS